MDVSALRVADAQSTDWGEPGRSSLHAPAMASEMLAALDAPSSDPWCDAARPTLASAATMIVALVCLQLVWCASRAPTPSGAHAWRRVEGRRQHSAVVTADTGEGQTKRRTPGIHDEVALRTLLPQSVEFRPVAQPFFLPPGRQRRVQRNPEAAPASRGSQPSRSQPLATRPAAANSSCRCSSPQNATDASPACRRTGRGCCPTAPPNPRRAASHLSASQAWLTEAARFQPKDRRV